MRLSGQHPLSTNSLGFARMAGNASIVTILLVFDITMAKTKEFDSSSGSGSYRDWCGEWLGQGLEVASSCSCRCRTALLIDVRDGSS